MKTNKMAIKPGFKAGLRIDEASKDEQKIIKKFSKTFFISFFRRTTFKQVNYTFVFGKPTEDFTIKFNIENEVLILFSNIDTFESRTLDYVDKLLTEYFNRLDKFCLVLVSNDPEIEKKIQNLNVSEQLSRVIVPFSYRDLLSDHIPHFFIENRFKKYFYSKDLFDFDSPIRTESFFFGRSSIVHEFFDRYSNSENSALFGLRKIGKTSVLYAVSRLCESKQIPVIYIDCQNPSFHQRRWYEALTYIINLAYQQNNKLSSRKFNLDPFDEINASKLFEEHIKNIQSYFRNERILIIFDEIENITFDISPTEHWAKGNDYLFFWQTIRSIFQSNRDIFSFVLAGVNPHILEKTSIKSYDNPIFKIATPKYLNLFDIETVNEMVTKIGLYMGLKFEPEVIFLLYEDFGGHPFLTRIACSNINKYLPKDRPQTITKYWYRVNRDKFIRPVINYVEQLLSVLKNFYSQEYELLEILASGNTDKFAEIVEGNPTLAEHLAGYGLVNMLNNQYYFKLKIVEDFINLKNTKIRSGLSLEEKWAEISKRRNRIEQKLRKLAFLIMRINYGNDAKKKILNAVPTERREQLEHLEIDQILEEKFYFIDLMQLYVKEFKNFENIFEKQSNKFYSAMDHINRFRVDAHAKSIEEDEYQMLILEFNWLEKCLKNIKF